MSEDKVEDTAEGNNLAVPVAVATPELGGEKQGAKCCGCCCDYRRAVIITAIVGIVMNIFEIIVRRKNIST